MNKLPKVREEIGYQILKYENAEYVKLIDKAGFTDKEPIFPLFMMEVIQLANDGNDIDQLKEILKNNFGEYYEEIFESYNAIIDALDEYGFLQTENFELLKKELLDYQNSPIRKSSCSGSSFSENRDEAIIEISEILNSQNELPFDGKANAILVPHIDFRIPDSHFAYSRAYKSICNTESDLYVIIGTSHYGNSDYLMFCDKHFETPIGVVETDLELLNKIKDNIPDLTIDNRAHKDEHSIEYQVMLLQNTIKRPFKILPILADSLFDYVSEGIKFEINPDYFQLIEKLKNVIMEHNPNAVFISSGDLAHIGKRFGDEFAAREELEKLKIEDELLIKDLTNIDQKSFLEKIISCNDARKVCGTAPFYGVLQMLELKESRFLAYNQWDDFMTESAVSYCAIAFR